MVNSLTPCPAAAKPRVENLQAQRVPESSGRGEQISKGKTARGYGDNALFFQVSLQLRVTSGGWCNASECGSEKAVMVALLVLPFWALFWK